MVRLDGAPGGEVRRGPLRFWFGGGARLKFPDANFTHQVGRGEMRSVVTERATWNWRRVGERRDEFSAQGVEDFYRRLDFRGRLILPTAGKILARCGGEAASVGCERQLPVPKSVGLHCAQAAAAFHVVPEQLAIVAAGNDRAPIRMQHASAG